MVELARRRAALFAPNSHARFIVAPAEQTGIDSESFDLIVGKWILHHVDVSRVADEISRLLRPGGRGVFIENSGLNPVLAFARRHLTGRFGIARYGTADEHPLVEPDYDELRQRFADVRLHYPLFDFFRIFDRQVLRYRFHTINRATTLLDRLVQERIPRLRRYSFRVVIEVDKR
jgi:SAM-dependent methyltransferase